MDQEDPTSEDNRKSEDSRESETEDLKDKYLRLFAEFDNYKKRTIRERLDLMKSAHKP